MKVNISLKLKFLLLEQTMRVLTLSNNLFLDCRYRSLLVHLLAFDQVLDNLGHV